MKGIDFYNLLLQRQDDKDKTLAQEISQKICHQLSEENITS